LKTKTPIPAPATLERPPGASRALALALSDIKLAHSVFALPFALLASFMSADLERPARFGAQLVVIVACMVLARTWAMMVNRLADHRFDAANPRTRRRVIASGALGVRQGWTIALASAGLFIACCAAFLVWANPWPLILSVPVLAWIALYSYTKRFTALAHLFLGAALAISPIAAMIAIDPDLLWSWSPQARAVVLLAGFVLLWVAGFDVDYALQDLDFDRRTGLRSIPARLGPRGALWVSRAMHTGAFALLVAANFPDERLAYIFSFATIGVGAILVFEHTVLARRGVAGRPLAFFTLNGVVSVVLGVAGCVDVVV